jgi:S1-C subfamily serine protease
MQPSMLHSLPSRSRLSRLASSCLMLLAAVSGWAVTTGCRQQTAAAPGQPATDAPVAFGGPLSGPMDLSRAFRAAAEQVLPAVVQVTGRGEPEPLLGSGVIVDPSGVVLTNHHVVDASDPVAVRTSDGRRYGIRRVAGDPHSDLAILELEVTGDEPLPAARMGDSRALGIGDWVLTIGSPLDLGPSVSAGIISATQRIPEGAARVPLLQTDAAINPGSSGGALVNLSGELVGIATAIASRDGGFQGIGFAIPTETARPVIAHLREHGEVDRADIDVPTTDPHPQDLPQSLVYSIDLQASVAEPTSDQARAPGLSDRRGVQIARIDPQGPGYRAGLRAGMVIVQVGPQPIDDVNDFADAMEHESLERGIVLRVQDAEGPREIRVDQP